MPQWLQHISGVHVVILLSIVSSLWGAIAKSVKEKAEARRVETEKKQREENLLRTGRAEPSGAVGVSITTARPQQLDPRRMMEEIAAKRQAQLEELRRKQLNQGGVVRPAQASTPVPISQPAPQVRVQQQVMKPAAPGRPQMPSNRPAGQANSPRPQPTDLMRRQAETERVRAAVAAETEERGRHAPLSRQGEAAHQSMLREREKIEREQRGREATAAKARAVAQAAPAAEVAHARGGSSVGVTRSAAAGITVLGAKVSSATDWRRIMAIQAILGPSAATREMDGRRDPLSS